MAEPKFKSRLWLLTLGIHIVGATTLTLFSRNGLTILSTELSALVEVSIQIKSIVNLAQYHTIYNLTKVGCSVSKFSIFLFSFNMFYDLFQSMLLNISNSLLERRCQLNVLFLHQ